MLSYRESLYFTSNIVLPDWQARNGRYVTRLTKTLVVLEVKDKPHEHLGHSLCDVLGTYDQKMPGMSDKLIHLALPTAKKEKQFLMDLLVLGMTHTTLGCTALMHLCCQISDAPGQEITCGESRCAL